MSTNQQKMMLWLEGQVQGYKGVALENYHTSWRDGLVHSLSPRCGINFDNLAAADAEGNLTLAFNTAEKFLGIAKLLDVEDMISGPKPEQFSVITYLGQFYKKYGANQRLLVRTTTAPQLMTAEKTKQLEALAEVRERFGIKPGNSTAVVEKAEEPKERKQLHRTVSVAAVPTHAPKSASEILKEKKDGETAKPKVANKEDLFKRCHKSGVVLHGVTPVEWNGNVYHPDKFMCTTCGCSFKGGKEIVNVSNEPYCKDCGKKAFLVKNKKVPTTSTSTLNKKIVPLEAPTEVVEEVTVSLPAIEQKSSIPLWRQKLAEKKEQLQVAKEVIDKTETKRMSVAKQKRLSRAPENQTAAAEDVTCVKCGKLQKKVKFCNSCGNALTNTSAPTETKPAETPKEESGTKQEFENPLFNFKKKPESTKTVNKPTTTPETKPTSTEKKGCAQFKPQAYKKTHCMECYLTQAEHNESELDKKQAAEKLAAEKLAAEKKEKLLAEKLAAEKLAAEKLAAGKLIAEKLALEKQQAAEKLAAEKLATEKLAAEKQAAEKLVAEKLAAEKQAAEKLAAEKLASEKLAAEKQAAEKLAAEKLAAEKLAAEKLAAEKRAAEKQAAEKLASEKLAAEKLAAQKLAGEKLAAEKLAAEKLAAEKLAAERLAAEKLAAEKLAIEKAAAQKLAAEKLAAEKLAAERLAAERLAAEKLALTEKNSDALVASLRKEIEQLKAELQKSQKNESDLNNQVEQLKNENNNLKSALSKAQNESQNSVKSQQMVIEEEPVVLLSFPKPKSTATLADDRTASQKLRDSNAEKQAAEKLAAEKLAAEKLAAQQEHQRKLAGERIAAEKQAAEKQAAEKLAAEKLAAEKLEAIKQNAHRVAAERLAAEKQQQQQQKPSNVPKNAITTTIPTSDSGKIPAWKQKLIDAKKNGQ